MQLRHSRRTVISPLAMTFIHRRTTVASVLDLDRHILTALPNRCRWHDSWCYFMPFSCLAQFIERPARQSVLSRQMGVWGSHVVSSRRASPSRNELGMSSGLYYSCVPFLSPFDDNRRRRPRGYDNTQAEAVSSIRVQASSVTVPLALDKYL